MSRQLFYELTENSSNNNWNRSEKTQLTTIQWAQNGSSFSLFRLSFFYIFLCQILVRRRYARLPQEICDSKINFLNAAHVRQQQQALNVTQNHLSIFFFFFWEKERLIFIRLLRFSSIYLNGTVATCRRRKLFLRQSQRSRKSKAKEKCKGNDQQVRNRSPGYPQTLPSIKVSLSFSLSASLSLTMIII